MDSTAKEGKLRQRRHRSSSSSGRRRINKDHEGIPKSEEQVSVEAQALRSAWQPWPRLLLTVSMAPVVLLGVSVASKSTFLARRVVLAVAVSAVAGAGTWAVVPSAGEKLLPHLNGVDLGRRGLGGRQDGMPLPESLGLVSAAALMGALTSLQLLTATNDEEVLRFHSALLSVCFATLLGLVDDVVDIKWRHKLPVGVAMSLPLLVTYSGLTSIAMPKFVSPFIFDKDSGTETSLGQLLDLIPTVKVGEGGGYLEIGLFYYLFMLCLSVFCTNAINIYAGINGLEVGQSLIIGLSIMVVNLLDLHERVSRGEIEEQDIESGTGKNHLFSLMIMVPFVTTSLGLLFHNFFPAKCFVGELQNLSPISFLEHAR